MIVENPLRIGDVLRDVLMGSSLVAEKVGGIYPYTTQSEAKHPFIVYDGIVVDYVETKDGAVPSEITVNVNVNAGDYDESIAIAEEVLDVLMEEGNVSPLSVGGDYDNAAMMYKHEITIKVYIV